MPRVRKGLQNERVQPPTDDGYSDATSDDSDEEEVAESTFVQAHRSSGTVATSARFAEMHAFLNSTKRKASEELQASTPKKTKADDKASPSKAKKSPAQKQSAATPAGGSVPAPAARESKSPAKSPSKFPLKVKLAVFAGGASARRDRRTTAAEPDAQMGGFSRDYDEGTAAKRASVLSGVQEDAPGTTSARSSRPEAPTRDLHTYSGALERSVVDPFIAKSTTVPSESIFMPGNAERVATFALNAASSSGATITVPLVDYESLVRFYESWKNLEGMTGVSRAARRGREAVDDAYRALKDKDEALRSIGAAELTLKRLQEKIEACRRELGSTEKETQKKKSK
ncbi:hypothetical protein EXIGLDRAFT_708919 [Exidia glandulosa HHB12029]|uniref:Uncharacterized protein n=1 Tax=Exidia glandulosa HHB12029 TaxID=1314781 RepID=A0A166N116_EXIGL|nr:hypothetical protein EXIGLDRAFT_708919 [Exidia glandulosa HHB12029]